MYIKMLMGIMLAVATGAAGPEQLACNGHVALCARRYNEVAYPATHNGQSHALNCEVSNQDLDLKEQLLRGIRASKIHVWYDTNEAGYELPFVCHGIDKALLYNPPIEKGLEQVPFIFRSFSRTMVEKAQPFRPVVTRAFEYAYGKDNSSGAIPFPHCIMDPARRPLYELFETVHDFLQTHPREVLTLILEDHTHNLERIYHDLAHARLTPYLHVQKKDHPWPTLGEMIEKNKRLVIFVQSEPHLAYKKHPGLHYLWDYAWDTPWLFKNPCELKESTVTPLRGKEAFKERHKMPRNKVFVVHHFIPSLVGGNKMQAHKVNKRSLLRHRLTNLARKTGHMPNIVEVDFFQYPDNDLFDVIDEMNGVGAYAQ